MTSSKTATDCAHVETVRNINDSGSGEGRGAVVEGAYAGKGIGTAEGHRGAIGALATGGPRIRALRDSGLHELKAHSQSSRVSGVAAQLSVLG